jgi:DNA-binding response OmpR family regulator
MSNVNDQKVKVLVIEDNAPMQLVLSHHLKNIFHIQMVNDGVDAMSYLHEGNLVDLIISDLNTPRMNGYELIEQLRVSGFFSTIPIIVLSGEDSTETKIKCLEAGADDYLVKPFNPRELMARINALLRRIGKLSIN